MMEPPKPPRTFLNLWLHEPLLHFLIAGALLFAIYSWLNRGDESRKVNEQLQVRVSHGDVKWLSETWSRQWRREPTPDELRGLVTDYVKELLMAREAQELGLAENDTIVRRRLKQKLEFLLDDASRLMEPTEADLLEIYEAHPEKFQSEAQASFTHIYFNTDRRPDAKADAVAALQQLRENTGSPDELGDPLMIEFEFRDATRRAIARQVGGTFADAVLTTQPGEWTGPITSGFGLHLVKVTDVKSAQLREFSDVQDEVREVWDTQQEKESQTRYFDGLLEKYEVVMDDEVKLIVGMLGGDIAANENE